MPKTTRTPQPPTEEPAIRAAFITRRGAIIVACIAALATVAAALIGKWYEKSLPIEPVKFVIKVLDKETSKPVVGAKVSIEGNGVPAVNTTDSEGVITFPLADPKKELRVRVGANGYENNFNLRVTPANVEGLVQEIRLMPIRIASASPSPSQPVSVITPVAAPATNRSVVIRGQVVDELGAGVSGARHTRRIWIIRTDQRIGQLRDSRRHRHRQNH